MNTFTSLGTMLLDATTLFDPSVTASYMGDLKPLASAALGLYLLWLMIPLFLGKGHNTAEDVMQKILVWMIVWVFAFNGGGYLDMVQKGMNDFFTWAGGGVGFFNNLDTWAEKLQTSADTIQKMDKSYFQLEGILAQSIVMFAGFIISFVPFLIIVFTSFVVQILVMLAPFMILAFIFPTIKKMFFNAVDLFFTMVLVVLIISVIQKSLVKNIDAFANGVEKTLSSGGDTSITSIAINILIMCLVYTFLMFASVPIAKAISGASGMGVGKDNSGSHKDL